MGFFSNLTGSWNKSSKLQQLERIIAPPIKNAEDMAAELRRRLEGGIGEKDRALESFLDLCESDEGIRKVMAIETISRADLREIYAQLLFIGLGQWVKGHYAALSTIAYVEPLQYSVRAKKNGVGMQEIAFNLLEYWEDRIPKGGLLRQLQ
jgi:hypothetical protein